nr:polyketide hydroxylase whie VIII [Amycolatopsis sp.]
MSDERVPVLIAGGGLAGLSTALFLGLHGVPALLVERHAGTATEIKARGFYPHTMEALRIGGVAERVREAGGRRGAGDLDVVIAERLSGPIRKGVMTAGEMTMAEVSPEDWSLASQEQVEPILAERARELGAVVRFRTELRSFGQDADGVTAVLRDTGTGTERTVRADYLVGADGWRSGVRSGLGIGVHGRGVLGHMLRIFFEADLTEQLAHLPGVADGRRFALVHLVRAGSRATFYTTGVAHRYGYFRSLTPEPGDHAGQPEDWFTDLVRTGLDLPADLPVKLVDVGETAFSCAVADRLSLGRVHLVGDAAKVVPPTGGLGGNTAVMDGFYLGWKLAAVARGLAGPALLDSHDAERRPVADLVAEQQLANLVTRAEPELADGPVAAPLPPVVQVFGYRYARGAVVREAADDGALLEDPLAPTGRPGSRAPYVRLAAPGGPTSTTALFGGGFTLLTGPDGGAWRPAARLAADRLGIPLATHVIGTRPDPAALTDPAGTWLDRYGIRSDGAVLVRPDRFIAWRAVSSEDTAGLEHALRTVLDRLEPETGE